MSSWIAIVGRREDGRERVTARLWQTLAAGGAKIAGFMQAPVHLDGEHIGYDIWNPSSDERSPLARISDDAELCNWGFVPEGWAVARRWALESPGDVCFIEAGRREAAEQGHWPTLTAALDSRPLTVLSIRPAVLASIALRLPDPIDGLELPAAESEIEAFLERAQALLASSS